MTRHWSISRRLVLVLTAGLGLLWLGGAALSTIATMHEINEVLDSALQETAQRLLPLATHDLAEHEDEGGLPIGDDVPGHEEYLIYQIRDARGRVVLRSHDAPLAPFPVPLVAGFTDHDDRRFYTEISEGSGYAIQITEVSAHRSETMLDSVFFLAAPMLLLLPLAGVAIFWIVGRSTTVPIRTMREAIRARSGSNLDMISDEGMPVELAPIVKDVNRLLERLGLALAGERAFAANSAHELRTPVAAALAQLQRLNAELGASPHRPRIEQIIAALRRLGNLVEKMLQLSRAESGIAMTGERVDLLPVLRLLLDEFGRNPARGGRIQFEPPPVSTWMAQIDIDAFAIVLRNLLDNALNHGAADKPVRVFLDRASCLHVVNAGAVVPAPAIPRLTDRFARGDTMAQGSGLGLAIADTIMRQAGGRLELHSPAMGEVDGFEAVICLAAG